MGASGVLEKAFFLIIVRASPLASYTIRERGRSHNTRCKTEMIPVRSPLKWIFDNLQVFTFFKTKFCIYSQLSGVAHLNSDPGTGRMPVPQEFR